MQASAGTPLAWRSAPQPDIVRAAQKDDLYLQQTIDACYNAVMRLFGAVPALQHSRSCKLLATFVYYALTTGAGLQTLGEEYCDIVQLSGRRLLMPGLGSSNSIHQGQQQQQHRSGVAPPQHLPSLAAPDTTRENSNNSNQPAQEQPPACQPVLQHAQQQQQYMQLHAVTSYGLPTPQRRVLLVLLQLLGPALLDRVVASLDRASAAGTLAFEIGGSGHDGSWGDSIDADSSLDNASAYAQEHYSQQQQQRGDAAFAGLTDHDAATGSSQSDRHLLLHLKQCWRQAVHWLAPRWPAIKPWMLFIGRLHLAAFYLNGTYYEWTKRLMGIRYSSISASKEPRASYRVLGLMLVVQLAISAVQQAQPQLSALRHSISSSPLQQKQGRQQQQQRQHAIVLPESGGCSSSLAKQQRAAAASNSSWGSRQCPLCLSVRTHPTCTPCGHVFCWHCIAQWCTEKPECPLCRTAVVCSQLVCVCHSDF